MNIRFEKITDFNRGTLFELLKDAYSFDSRYEEVCAADWREFDDFFYDNPQIADKCGFITTADGDVAGFVSWDPRKMPEFAEIGHNCVAVRHKGKGLGKIQLREALDRILQNEVEKIIVTTNDDLIPAQRMYESVGFKLHERSKVEGEGPTREHIEYVYEL